MAVDIQGHYAYIGNGYSLQILDITNLDAPVIVGEYVTSAVIYDIRLRGDSLAFVCNWDGFLIFDVSNPTAPEKLSEISLWGGNRVIPTDSFAYVASGGLVNIIDITDLRNPYIRSQAAGDGGEGGRDELTLFNGRYLYLGDPAWPTVIYAYDCSDPGHLVELSNLNIGWFYSFSVRESSNLLLVGGTMRMKIYSLTDPANPTLLAIDTISTGYPGINAVTVSDYSGDYPFDVAFVVSGSKWLYTIAINNPLHPQVLDSISVLQTAGDALISFPMKVRGTIGIAAYDGLFLVDAQDPNALQAKSVFVAGGDGPLGIAVEDQYAYLANGIAGLAILDITNPTRPVRVGSLLCGGTEIDALAIEGSYAYAVGHYGLWTVDVSNRQAPALTSWIPIGSPAWGPPSDIAVERNHAYVSVHDSSVVILDLTNPAAPARIGTYFLPANGSPTYHLAAHDSLLYVAMGDSLVILDVEDPQHGLRLSGVGVHTDAVVAESNYVYSGADGLTILGVSIPQSPIVVSVIGSAPGTDMALSGKYVYLSLNTGILTAVDVENPSSPWVVGTYNPFRAYGVVAQDRFVYLCEVYAGLQIFENKLVSHQQHYSFDAGWNMISVPSFPDGNNSGAKGVLFPSSASSAFTYQSGYIVKDTLERGRGYWLKFDAAQDILLPDVPVYSDSIAVASGWNMIGSISIPVSVSRIGSNPANIVTSQLYGLGGSSGYEIADTIQPGRSYWIRASQSASLILPTEVALGKATPSNSIRIVPTSERPPSVPDPATTNLQSRIPKRFALEQNYPNPFNPVTTFNFKLPTESHVTLKIFNVLGQEVTTLVNEVKKPGEYSVTWDASDLPSGVYYYMLLSSKGKLTKKMLILR